MRQLIQSILLKVAESVSGESNKVSTPRLQSYLILFPILFMVLIFLIIEIWSFIHAIKHGTEYHLSNEIIIIFGMMLSHHLAVLFSRNKIQSIAEIKGTEPVKDEPVVEEPKPEDKPKDEEKKEDKPKDDNFADQV